MYKIAWCSAFMIVLCTLSTSISSQREMSFPMKKVRAFAVSFEAPYDSLIVDIDQSDFIGTENILVPVLASTRVVDRKNRRIDRHLVRRGMEIEITGSRSGTGRIEASEIRLLTDLEKWDVSADGYFESLDGETAWIDGRAVRLAPGASLRGQGDLKNQRIVSFSDLSLGYRIEVEGVRRPDGIIYARTGKVKRNEFTAGDIKMFNLAKEGRILPAKLEGGVGSVGGKDVRFANDFDLQAYVTRVGNRLVPRYQRDLPGDYKGKITYRFAVIEDDSFNAFALPDGAIFIHTGLLKKIKNEAQLAAIIGHEIAHVTHEHARDRFEDPKSQWGSLALILGGAAAGGEIGAQAGAIAANALSNKFGRDAENQADRVGLFYMVQAGYDPREAPKVWREIAGSTRPDVVANFLYSDHASARARLKYLNREIAYSYYDRDFTAAKVGTEDYINAVGVYFGWKPRPIVKAPVNSTPVLVATKTKADKQWNLFWTKFSRAMLAKNRPAIKLMTSKNFFDGGGGQTVSQWMTMLDQRRAWHLVQNSVRKGAVSHTENDGRIWRVTPDKRLRFVYEKTGWRFYGVMGD